MSDSRALNLSVRKWNAAQTLSCGDIAIRGSGHKDETENKMGGSDPVLAGGRKMGSTHGGGGDVQGAVRKPGGTKHNGGVS